MVGHVLDIQTLHVENDKLYTAAETEKLLNIVRKSFIAFVCVYNFPIISRE
jgi:hypothetical protein